MIDRRSVNELGAVRFSVDSLDPSRTALVVVDMQNDFLADDALFRSEQAVRLIPELRQTLEFCRRHGMRIVYTVQAHRPDGSDLGSFAGVPEIAAGRVHVLGTSGVEVTSELQPAAGEPVVVKHWFSGFFGTDLDIILRGYGIDTVVVTGTTTENCCHATARDAMARGYRVIFLSDATGSLDYPDVGQGAMTADEVHRATLVILAWSSAHVMSAAQFRGLKHTSPDRQALS